MPRQTIYLMSRRDDPFSRVPKTTLKDPQLSWKAKGILSYLIGQPIDWKVQIQDLVNNSADGETAIRSALTELRKAGYASLEKVKDGSGKIVEWTWKVSDCPIFLPDSGIPQVDRPPMVNHHITKTECTKNDITKTKESKVTPPPEGDCDYPATWKPTATGKVAQLRKLKPTADYPSQDEFDEFVTAEDLGNILNHRPGLYRELCICKWHQWNKNANRWVPIRDWQAYVAALDVTIGNAFTKLS